MSKVSLEQIHRNKTGKISDKWSSYLPFYDHLFSSFRLMNISLLEIGVQNGGSLETWSTYFENAVVLIGCDIDERCRNLAYDDQRIHVVVGDANYAGTVANIQNTCKEFDVIIDDGSHISNDILNSFIIYFPMLKPGGVYVIEDAHTLYLNDWGGGILNKFSAYSFFKDLIDVISIQFWSDEISIDVYFRTFFPLGALPKFIKEGWIESIEFRNSLIIIKKSMTPSNEKLGDRVISGNEAHVNNNI